MPAGNAVVEKGQRRTVVTRHQKIGPAVLIDIQHCQRLGITRHDQITLRQWHRGEVTMTIASQQLAESTIESTDCRNGRIGILYGINIRIAVPVEISRDQSLHWCNLRDLGQSFEMKCTVRLTEKNSAPKFRRRETLSGTPQGGLVSPVLSNIYLHKLDEFVEQELIPQYTRGARRKSNPEYNRIKARQRHARKHGDRAATRNLQAQMRTLPSSDPMDPGYRRLRYLRRR